MENGTEPNFDCDAKEPLTVEQAAHNIQEDFFGGEPERPRPTNHWSWDEFKSLLPRLRWQGSAS